MRLRSQFSTRTAGSVWRFVWEDRMISSCSARRRSYITSRAFLFAHLRYELRRSSFNSRFSIRIYIYIFIPYPSYAFSSTCLLLMITLLARLVHRSELRRSFVSAFRVPLRWNCLRAACRPKIQLLRRPFASGRVDLYFGGRVPQALSRRCNSNK